MVILAQVSPGLGRMTWMNTLPLLSICGYYSSAEMHVNLTSVDDH